MRHFDISSYQKSVKEADIFEYRGKVSQVIGLTVEAVGLQARMGDICRIYTGYKDEYVLAEVVGFKEKKVL